MPSAELITETVHRYLEFAAAGRIEDLAGLYADDATVEDPVGSDVHIGRRAIRHFYADVLGGTISTEVVTLRVLGREAAFFWRLTSDRNGHQIGVDIISTMAVNDEGRIMAMKAYWGPENITPIEPNGA